MGPNVSGKSAAKTMGKLSGSRDSIQRSRSAKGSKFL